MNLNYEDKIKKYEYVFNVNPILKIIYKDFIPNDIIFYSIINKKWYIISDDYDNIYATSTYPPIHKKLFPDKWEFNNINYNINYLKEFNNNSLKLLSPISIYKYLKYDINIKKIILTLILILKDKLPIEMIDKILSFNMVIDFI
jgi:hypothetical protein